MNTPARPFAAPTHRSEPAVRCPPVPPDGPIPAAEPSCEPLSEHAPGPPPSLGAPARTTGGPTAPPAPGARPAPPALAAPPGARPPSLLSPGVARDPYPVFRLLRESHPLARDELLGAWAVSRYEDVWRALVRPWLVAPPPGRTLVHLEGATHLAHRALVEPGVRGRALAALAGGVSRGAHVLARRIAAHREADLVAEFCRWLPTAAVVSALGLPHEDAARVHAWCYGGLTHLGGHHHDLDACLRPHLARRRERPGDDLLSVLCTAEVDERPLSDSTVTGLVGALLGGGGDATALALGSFLANLLDHPDTLALVRERPELTPAAWAESLRRDPPAPVVLRRAIRPVVVAGAPLPAGAVVACLVGAAGRDPARFADPDRYDILRTDQGGLAFGAGRHSCLGAELAGRVAAYGLHALLDAMPGMRWAPGFRPAPQGLLTRGPRSLLVRPG
ncbi:cytochrome P450 [Streptomyces sp. NPDC046465]|uniref:cytochrome P450 n=1 Tax=Streptomyces sp. NPDC046465 TaxID=3155810 RepID=UPI0033E310F3